MALAPRTVQNIPDRFRRGADYRLAAGFDDAGTNKRCCRRNLGYRIRSALRSKYSASMRSFSVTSGLLESMERSAATSFSILPLSSRRFW